VALRKCSGVVRSTKVLWADVKAGTFEIILFPNKIFFLLGKQNIFNRGEKKGRVFSSELV
jgi:hypothetical protein